MQTFADEHKTYASQVHKGHRQRTLQKFLKYGFDAFAAHEVLEMLLFYAVPRKDTNPLAHELINKFGSIGNIFDADIEELTNAGLTVNGAVLLKTIPQLMQIYAAEHTGNIKLDSTTSAKEYFYTRFIGAKTEQVCVACLDSSMRLISCELVSSGERTKVLISPRKVAEIALRNKCRSVFIAHNHPFDDAAASDNDIASTRALKSVLDSVDVQLLDHIIVGKNRTISMKETGTLSVFDI